MNWVGMLRTWLVGPNLDAVAEEIAAAGRSAVWQRIHHRIAGLALAEARGYVRIKAKGLVQQAVARKMQENQLIHGDNAEYLQQLTMEAVLRLAILDLVHARQLVAREEARPLRRAA